MGDEEESSEKEYVKYVPLPGELPSEFRKKMNKIQRIISIKTKRADEYIKNVQSKSDNRLQKRNRILKKTSQLEDLRRSTVMQNTELKEKFTVEVDEAIEIKAQNRAKRLYHREQIEMRIPKWLKTMDEISSVTKAKGHNDKLMWRHFALQVMKRCIKEAADDPLAIEARLRLLNVSRRLNMFHANDLLRKMQELKDSYFTDNEIGNTELARHCKAFADAKDKRTDHIDTVPLPKDDWSDTIEFQKSTLDHTLATTNMMADDGHTLATFEFASTMSSSAIQAHDGPSFVVDDGTNERNARLARERDDVEKVRSARLVQLRLAAARGDFLLAWSVFRNYIDPLSGGATTKLGGHPRPVPKEVYRMLLVAVKNGGNRYYEESGRILEHMQAGNVKPDVGIYNMIIGSCVAESRWRRALSLMREMQDKHGLVPNAFSLQLLADCCRHTLEEPGVVYETLRTIGKLPSDFCYNVALCNAGNRLSAQVIAEAVHDATDKLPDAQISTFEIGKHYSEPIPKANQKMTQTGKQREFNLGMRNTLSLGSPAKYSFSRTAMAFDRQMEKHIIKPGKDYASRKAGSLPPLYVASTHDDAGDVIRGGDVSAFSSSIMK